MNTISFMTANYVARQLDYDMTEGWGQGEAATNAYFEPPDTFAGRFDELLADVQEMGFEAIDLWTAHLSWRWATDQHVQTAQRILDRRGLRVSSLAGGFGGTSEELDRCCQIARTLGATILGGSTPVLFEHRDALAMLLEKYDLVLAVENHPERTPEEMLEKIGDGCGGRVGTAVDTGWYATQGFNPPEALRRLAGHLMLVHLKDVRAPGSHETVRYGEGCARVRECVEVLKEIGYSGPISVEHEPESFDPTEDCRADLVMLRGWLAEQGGGEWTSG